MKVLLWAPTALSALLSLRALAFVAYQGLNGAADPDRTMEEAVAAKPRCCTRKTMILYLID